MLRGRVDRFTTRLDRCEISDSIRRVGLLGQLLYDISKALLNLAAPRRHRRQLLLFDTNSGVLLRIGLCNGALLIFFDKRNPLSEHFRIWCRENKAALRIVPVLLSVVPLH